jgi:hypothetical protein
VALARPQERKQPAVASAIVTPAPMKKRRGPVMRDEQQHNGQEQPRRSAIVEPRRKPRTTLIFGPAPDDCDPEAPRRAGEKADELFREIVRRAARKE